MDKSRKVIFRFIVFYFLSYVIFAFASTKFTPYLSSLGYSVFERGILLSSYAVTTIAFQLLFGFMSDKYQTMKRIVLICVAVYGIATAVLFSAESVGFAVCLLLVALSGGLLNTCCSLYDTWMLGCTEEISRKMSFVKTFGSIGWALGSLIASFLILHFSYRGLSAAILVISILLAMNLFVMPDIERIKGNTKIRTADIMELMRNKEYILIVVIYFLLYSMIVANNCTVIDKMLYLNASDTEISLKWSLQSFLEMPTYLAGSYLLSKIKGSTLAKISAVMMTVQFMIFAVVQEPKQILLACLLQVFSTPMVMITSKTLIQEIAPLKLRSSSQMIALSIFMGGSSMIIPTVAGFLSVKLGFNLTLFLVAGCGVAALSLLLLFSRLQKNRMGNI